MNTSAKKLHAGVAIKPLYKGFNASSFDSGCPPLDDWLRKHAWANHAADSAKTYVCTVNNVVIGYYSLAAGSVRVDEVVTRIRQGQPKAGSIPVTILCRLAVDKAYQKKGIGAKLLAHALQKCLYASQTVASRAVIVHAISDDAKAFYKKYDFEASPFNETSMMLLMKDLKKAAEEDASETNDNSKTESPS